MSLGLVTDLLIMDYMEVKVEVTVEVKVDVEVAMAVSPSHNIVYVIYLRTRPTTLSR